MIYSFVLIQTLLMSLDVWFRYEIAGVLYGVVMQQWHLQSVVMHASRSLGASSSNTIHGRLGRQAFLDSSLVRPDLCGRLHHGSSFAHTKRHQSGHVVTDIIRLNPFCFFENDFTIGKTTFVSVNCNDEDFGTQHCYTECNEIKSKR